GQGGATAGVWLDESESSTVQRARISLSSSGSRPNRPSFDAAGRFTRDPGAGCPHGSRKRVGPSPPGGVWLRRARRRGDEAYFPGQEREEVRWCLLGSPG